MMRHRERELDETLRAHLEMLAEEFEEQGMSPEEARAAARRAFGGVDQVKETCRDGWRFARLESLFQDVRYGLRSLRRSPAFTAAAVLSLALGIGANTAVFSLFYTLMLRMLPVRAPEQLVSLHRTGGWGRGFISYPLYRDLREQFPHLLARTGVSRVRFGADFAAREFVSGNYFQVLGVEPALGRMFDDDRAAAAVLSYDCWRTRFGGDPGVVGRGVAIEERPFTIVAVAPPGFRGISVEDHTEVWLPLLSAPRDISNPGSHWIWAVARLTPGTPPGQAQAAADVVMERHLRTHYGARKESFWRKIAMGQRVRVRPAAAGLSVLRDQFEKPLLVLLLVVGLVLLVACASVANLLLARAAARRGETALRVALGASRGRLLRQHLTECGLLAALGAFAGFVLGLWLSRGILWFLPEVALDVSPDGTVLAFTGGVAILTTLVAGLLPAWRSTRRVLVIAQVSFSLVLAVTAGLFGRSLRDLRTIDLGFRNDGVLSFEVDYPRAYELERMIRTRERLMDRIGVLPGVLSTSYGIPGPYQGGSMSRSLRLPGSERTEVEVQAVGARYFETIGSPLVGGREFQPHDTGRVAVVNEAFARQFFGGADPVGRALTFDDTRTTNIIGLARNILHQGVRQHAVPTVYIPLEQAVTHLQPVLLVRGPESTLPLVRRELAAMDPALALYSARTIRARIDDSIFLERMVAAVSSFFGMLALVLAVIGLYGVVAYSVARRTPEIGIRLALGARRRSVVWMVLREGLLTTAAGMAIGAPLALAASRLGARLLYGVKPGDPVTLIGAILILMAAAALAAFIPGLRAATIDPNRALRHE